MSALTSDVRRFVPWNWGLLLFVCLLRPSVSSWSILWLTGLYMVLLQDSANLFISIYGNKSRSSNLALMMFLIGLVSHFSRCYMICALGSRLSALCSLLSTLLTCSGFLLSIALMHLLHLLHQSKCCMLVHLFLVILFKIPFPTSVSLSVSVLKHVHIQSQTVVWFCFYLTTRGLCGLSSLTLNIIFFCWIYTCFFQDTVGKLLPCLTFCLTGQGHKSSRNATSAIPPVFFHIYFTIYEVNVVLMRTTECHIKPLTLNGKMHLK